MRIALAWIFGFLLAAVAMPASAAGATRNVLVLFESARLLPGNAEGERGIRSALESSADRRVDMYVEFLDVPRFSGETYARTVATFLREKYASLPPDVIVVAGNQSLKFVLDNREQLFPGTPIVHVAATTSFLRSFPAMPADVVGTPVEYDAIGTVELALRLHPDASQLVLVTGASEWDRSWEARLRNEVLRFGSRVKSEFLAGLPTETVRKRLAALGRNAVVFTPGYFEDGDGRIFTPRESVAIIAAESAAPVYGPFPTFIGAGAVGGSMPSFEGMGRRAGETANALLAGVAPAVLSVPTVTPTQFRVDWRQATRWGVRERDVPADTILEFKVPSFWEAHRNEVIVTVAVILLQAALIAALLFERQRRRRTASALQESEARMNLAARAAGLSTWAWDVARGRIAATRRSRRRENPAVERSIEVSRLLETIHPADRESVDRAMQDALVKGAEVDVEYRVVRPNGEVRWIAARGRTENANRQRLLGVALDVTDRKGAELQAARDRVALQHMTRVSVLGQLSASIAHQLNQPLAAILGNAEAARTMLSRDRVDLAELREICDDIVTEDHRAADIITHLRELFRRTELRREPIDMNALLNESLDLVRAELVIRQVTPVGTLASSLPTISGDRVQLQQVLLNLIVNAADAMAAAPEQERRLTLRTETIDAAVRVCIADRGPGIPPDDLKRVFEPFWSSKPEGMGIGLAISRSIVAAHGGILAAANNPDRGATFCFTLPVTPQP